MRKSLYLFLLAIVMMMVGSCQVAVEPILVTGVNVSPASLTMEVGESQTLSVMILPFDADNQAVMWSSSNTAVATVKEGVVTAVSGGNAIITATTVDGGKTSTCSVTVKPEFISVESISLDKNTLTLPQGDYENLFARITPSNATNTAIVWESSDNSVATVYNGKVTAVKVGKATITATTQDGGKTAKCEVTVIESNVAVTGVSLSKTTLDLIEGDIVTLVAKTSPENAAVKTVTWSSSDDTVATVSEGKVTAVKAGSATITVTTTDGGKTATCAVTVKAKSSSTSGSPLD